MRQPSLFKHAHHEEGVRFTRPVNVASVTHRSPFRYPGGKTWFVPRLREWIQSRPKKPALLIEPFAGGGIISLTALFENLVDKALMVELDEEIAAVWKTILEGHHKWLADKILHFNLTKENTVREVSRNPQSVRDLAFRTILKNRTYHGGILADGSGFLKNGEAGKGIASRWYPETLARRLRNLQTIAPKLRFIHGDGLDVLQRYKERDDAVFFIDPPYTAGGKKAGKRLYRHHALEHEKLFSLCKSLKGDFIMTYDNSDEVKALATGHGFQAKPIPMKNTHHAEMTELIVGRNLNWASGIQRVAEVKVQYGTGR